MSRDLSCLRTNPIIHERRTLRPKGRGVLKPDRGEGCAVDFPNLSVKTDAKTYFCILLPSTVPGM